MDRGAPLLSPLGAILKGSNVSGPKMPSVGLVNTAVMTGIVFWLAGSVGCVKGGEIRIFDWVGVAAPSPPLCCCVASLSVLGPSYSSSTVELVLALRSCFFVFGVKSRSFQVARCVQLRSRPEDPPRGEDAFSEA